MEKTALERRWNAVEDELLIRAVTAFGEHDNWKTVAQNVPGRTNKACRKRWLHSLSPSVKKTAWTPSEDRLLIDLYNFHGPKWSAIARKIHGRTDDACSKRYREALDPNLKKDEWTPDEDVKLLEVYSRIGGKWGQVGQELRRSGLGCRNRWRMLERNRTKSLAAIQTTPQTVYEDPQFLHVDLQEPDMQPVWPFYYPPEAYPSVLGTESCHREHSFRVPSPQMPDSPEVPPFRFSSSSLSAALSDPPRTSPSLPPVLDERTCDQDQSASAALNNIIACACKDTVSPADLSLRHCTNNQIESFTNASASRIQVFPSPAASSSSSPLWRSPSISIDSLSLPPDPRPPGATLDHTSLETTFGADTSSSSSSPFVPPSSLSPADSPIPCPPDELPSVEDSPIERPPIEQFPTESLLFSSSPYYRSAAEKRQKKVRPRRQLKPLGEARLSLMLPLSADLDVRAYACGRGNCWPSTADKSHHCFATSRELKDHCRMDHDEDEPMGDRPYRCALAGCGKSWKTLNGLQYHLQISADHFQAALSSTFKSPDDGETPSQPALNADPLDKRAHICHHPRCFKAYKQVSGLRYHLKHGHPPDLPIQLEVVPPTLAREIPRKAKKLRRKDPSADDA